MKTELSSRRHIALVMEKISVLLLMITVIAFVTGLRQYGRLMVEHPSSTLKDAESTNLDGVKVSGPNRKLLLSHEAAKVQPNRIWGDKCSKSDIIINQGPTSPLPSGIPMYMVEIVNMCTTGCDISNIHLSCGWFSSARLINPRLFKRLDYDDCLVNNGKPLVNGHTISFQYANTFPYPLSISSVMC
ncbi:protein TAPETUM DETERMINANT 1-like [Cynara cardunculus var. scolymus]|uniref:Uncharacterized protein n=1 Tax=Cynara cardunculus var. scolymus TaxID=59895 RepID=A0A103YBQ4_CYNCS|nr:protein TAPETUM DETERMINANT 1-like [Cynara cardunculus var. scolymus]KVI06154.1 hypothetical protein Ccrd_015500 [Cynara cardunculus var. scolymus]